MSTWLLATSLEGVAPRLDCEVEGHRLFVVVVLGEVERRVPRVLDHLGPRHQRADVVPRLGRFDLDDLGAHLAEHPRGVRAGPHHRQVEDPHTVEGQLLHGATPAAATSAHDASTSSTVAVAIGASEAQPKPGNGRPGTRPPSASSKHPRSISGSCSASSAGVRTAPRGSLLGGPRATSSAFVRSIMNTITWAISSSRASVTRITGSVKRSSCGKPRVSRRAG